jgi:hypothetical protein
MQMYNGGSIYHTRGLISYKGFNIPGVNISRYHMTLGFNYFLCLSLFVIFVLLFTFSFLSNISLVFSILVYIHSLETFVLIYTIYVHCR